MGKSEVKSQQRPVYECVAPFAVWRDGIPVTYPAGYKVDEDDPIRRTHSDAFAPVTARPVEQATAAPGERRPVQIPAPPESRPAPETTITETTIKEADHARVH